MPIASLRLHLSIHLRLCGTPLSENVYSGICFVTHLLTIYSEAQPAAKPTVVLGRNTLLFSSL